MTDTALRDLLRKILGFFLLIISLPFIIVFLFGYVLYGLGLNIAIWISWIPRGKSILFVTSDSPVWQTYMDSEIIHGLESKGVILNWSKRKTWGRKPNLAIMAFRYFGGSQEFNPVAVVFSPFNKTKVFRFWQAFKDYKHGNSAPLEQMKSDLLTYIESKT